jgi:phospholipid-translocating ATPase
MDHWLRQRENDIDLSSLDEDSPLQTPRQSGFGRYSTGFSSARSSMQLGIEEMEGMVDENIAGDESAVIERCLQHINDFATEGLRTLLYGYRFIDESTYQTWKKGYLEATTSLVDRTRLIEEAGDTIEQDLELCAATAIEDKLQAGVPEAIDKLRRAKIKMWMLTGDKRETAINIGYSCRLIKDYSSVTVLDHEAGEVEHSIGAAVLAINGGNVAHSVVVVDGQTLAGITSSPSLATLFYELAILADSVICCRASPAQKAMLVKSIRKRVKKSITLAIGDGANDIAMIQEAHVGIGITGKEGLQAARTSDYSIAQFRFLVKLLLVHGRWNYVRTCKYTVGTFWKEMVSLKYPGSNEGEQNAD